ncbi:MAG: MgtC/SapB family protein [Lachnospiraceae bacterium]|nr:MgtC/SapB family protein [Lachnospiraceae bacterium]
MLVFEAEWLLRIICAAVVGGLIGFERHSHLKEAGIRTHAIVAMGAAVIMILSKYGFTDVKPGDPARLAAQVVSGIGFLGAGIIFVRHNIIQGMATAAGIWTTSSIGMAFGAGMYEIGGITGLLVVLIQIFFQRKATRDQLKTDMRLRMTVRPEGSVQEITGFLADKGYSVTGNRILRNEEDRDWILESEVYVYKDTKPMELLRQLMTLENVVGAEYIDSASSM